MISKSYGFYDKRGSAVVVRDVDLGRFVKRLNIAVQKQTGKNILEETVF